MINKFELNEILMWKRRCFTTCFSSNEALLSVFTFSLEILEGKG